MKISFFSAVSFGAQGTPGTYKFIEKCTPFFDLRIFAPLHGRKTVYRSNKIPIVPVRNFIDENNLNSIYDTLTYFDPDIIYIFNFPDWHKLLSFLKRKFPNKKFILDIKSPLLASGKKRQKIQKGGDAVFHLLDAIVTLAKSNISTWMPNCDIESMVYPLGLDVSSVKHIKFPVERKKCSRFVYIGSLHKHRQLDLLIKSFINFRDSVDEPVYLDIFGTGPDEEHLRKIASAGSNSKCIRFNGICPQTDLFGKIPDYDAGIAYVPYNLYDKSPSLKVIEYMASGLPVIASDTFAHKDLINQGFSISFFSNTISSIKQSLFKFFSQGFSGEKIKDNLESINKLDYYNIIHQYFQPLFKNLLKY
jgi:glycosyltransferase involved in cell wall biosynthesis